MDPETECHLLGCKKKKIHNFEKEMCTGLLGSLGAPGLEITGVACLCVGVCICQKTPCGVSLCVWGVWVGLGEGVGGGHTQVSWGAWYGRGLVRGPVLLDLTRSGQVCPVTAWPSPTPQREEGPSSPLARCQGHPLVPHHQP